MKRLSEILKENSGAASILVVLLMIVFITLGLSAMVFANSNYKLAQKTMETEKAYYALDSEAETVLAEIDSILIPVENTSGNDAAKYRSLASEALFDWIDKHPEYQGEYVSEAMLSSLSQEKQEDYCRFTIGTDDLYLEIGIAPLYPPLNQGKRYGIVCWQKKSAPFNFDDKIIID